MKFSEPATTNAIDQLKIVGQPVDRVDGKLKTTGRAPYAHERHDVVSNQAYGWILGAGIGKGRITSMDLAAAKAAPGVLAIVNAKNAGKLIKGPRNFALLLGGPEIQHYHQAIAIVVAETFEQARAAAGLVKVKYEAAPGVFDLDAAKGQANVAEGTPGGDPAASRVGHFEAAFASAPVQLDATYHTAHESHAMMEPHATIAAWEGDKLTLWTSNQMIAWTADDMTKMLGLGKGQVHVTSPFIGGGFGGKLFLRADILMAALGARAAGRPVKVALQRALIPNNTTHRSATIQRIRIGATKEGKISAIAHEAWSGNVKGGRPEAAALQTRGLYAGEHRMTSNLIADMDLPESNAMRAPGEAPGLATLEIAMDEMAEKLGMDPVEFRILNDTLVVPDAPPKPPAKEEEPKKDKKDKAKAGEEEKEAANAPASAPKNPPFSKRSLVECLREGAKRFGWDKRNPKPAQVREGRWLIGHGMAAAIRDNVLQKSAARVRLDKTGRVTVETDMTDIGTGSYTVIAQTAAETMGVLLEQVTVKLGDSTFPVSCGSGGQWGGNNSCAGVYAACMKLRSEIAQKAGIRDAEEAAFADGRISAGGRSWTLAEFASEKDLMAEDGIEYEKIDKVPQATFGAHFVEVAVDACTGETRVRRMLAVCAAGRIINPKTARSQVIGAMTMAVGAALMEELKVDKKRGYFVNHDLAGYEVPVHADIPHQEVIFLDETDPASSPMKAKGVGELGICGVAAAVANAVYNATGVRVRDYPVTLDKIIDRLPELA